MGDNIRNQVFAKSIFYKFPPQRFRTVLCIADGKMELSSILRTMGYDLVIYEPHMRKGSELSKSFKHDVKIFRKWFDRNDKIKVDLVVGMHPDEATVEILMYGKMNDTSFAIVPCCILGDVRFTSGTNGFKDWIRKLMNINEGTNKEVLKFNGKNVMLWKNTKYRTCCW